MKIELGVSNHPWRCIDEEGTRCKWLRTSKFGSVWFCKIFCEPVNRGEWEPLLEEGGCLVRHRQCISAEVTED